MAALNFPDHNLVTSYTNPDTGITYEWTNNSWKAVRTSQVSSGSGSQTLVSDTMPAPAGYEVGTLWWNSDSTDTSLYVLYQDPVGPNGDVGGKYWIEAAPAPDSIGFNGTHTGDSTFTGNMNVTGAGTFAGNVNSTGFDSSSDSGVGFKLFAAGQIESQRAKTGQPNQVQAVFRGYQGTDVTSVIDSDGSATFARAVNVNLAAGSTNGDFAVRSGTKKRVGIDAAGDIKLGDDIQSAQTILLRGSDGSAEFAGAVTSTEGFNGKYLTATTTTNTAGSVCLMISNSNGEIGRWRADNNFMIGGTPSSPVTANIHFNGNSGSATFAGNVTSGADTYTGNGVVNYASGSVYIQQSNANDLAFAVVHDNYQTPAAKITGNGSATFAGDISATGLDAGVVPDPGEAYASINVFPPDPFALKIADTKRIVWGNANSSIRGDGGGQTITFTTNANDIAEFTNDSLLIGAPPSTNPSIKLKVDGSATFAGETIVKGDLLKRTAAGSTVVAMRDDYLRVYDNPVSYDDYTISLEKDGSASFNGMVKTGSDNAGVATGTWLQDIGGVYTTRPAGSTASAFACFQLGGSSYTASINADGSATFVGGWGNDNGVLIDTNGFNVRADSGRGLGIYSGGNSDVNRTISLNGDGSATFAGTVTENASDRKFKENIVDAPAQLTDVSALQLRTWDWNDLTPGNEERNNRRSMGLVAQEAELVDSNLVYDVNESEDTYKAVDYKVLTMKLLGAVKELSAKVAALEAN